MPDRRRPFPESAEANLTVPRACLPVHPEPVEGCTGRRAPVLNPSKAPHGVPRSRAPVHPAAASAVGEPSSRVGRSGRQRVFERANQRPLRLTEPAAFEVGDRGGQCGRVPHRGASQRYHKRRHGEPVAARARQTHNSGGPFSLPRRSRRQHVRSDHPESGVIRRDQQARERERLIALGIVGRQSLGDGVAQMSAAWGERWSAPGLNSRGSSAIRPISARAVARSPAIQRRAADAASVLMRSSVARAIRTSRPHQVGLVWDGGSCGGIAGPLLLSAPPPRSARPFRRR